MDLKLALSSPGDVTESHFNRLVPFVAYTALCYLRVYRGRSWNCKFHGVEICEIAVELLGPVTIKLLLHYSTRDNCGEGSFTRSFHLYRLK